MINQDFVLNAEKVEFGSEEMIFYSFVNSTMPFYENSLPEGIEYHQYHSITKRDIEETVDILKNKNTVLFFDCNIGYYNVTSSFGLSEEDKEDYLYHVSRWASYFSKATDEEISFSISYPGHQNLVAVWVDKSHISLEDVTNLEYKHLLKQE